MENKITIYGYARVSTKKQCASLEEQITQLKKYGCNQVFAEAISGADKKRPQLTKLLSTIKTGDQLVVTVIDRLGWSLRDLIDIITHLKDQGITLAPNYKSFCNKTAQVELNLNGPGERWILKNSPFDFALCVEPR